MNSKSEMIKINRNAPIPLYQQILNEIRSRIASSEWPADAQLPTEEELELSLHVSRVTIRQALSAAVEEGLIVRIPGRGTFVSTNGSTPAKADGFIGYIVPHLSSSFNVQILLGVESIIRDAGCHMIFCNSEGDLTKENQLLQNLETSKMAGYIIQPVYSNASKRALSQLVSTGARLVLIDRDLPGVKTDSVMSDHFGGGRQIVRHLIDQGYQDIVYVAREPVQLHSIAERFRGYQAAMTGAGLKPRLAFTVGGPVELGYHQDSSASTPDEKLVVEKIAAFLRGADRPQAIVAMNDLVAMLVFDAAAQVGLRIPDDLGVVGFDDLDCACTMDLTTMAQRPFEIGSEAARLLLQRIRGNTEAVRQVLLPTQMVLHGSSINPQQA